VLALTNTAPGKLCLKVIHVIQFHYVVGKLTTFTVAMV
jgi:hypothetical protein